MLLTIITILVSLALGYAYLREGLFTAFTMCCNLIISGLVAFNFWEPLADMLDSPLSNSVLHGYEDIFCLLALFCVTLGALRTVTNMLANAQITLPPLVDRGGGVLFGIITGYLATGFLMCAFQTMPWHENFMFFDPSYDSSSGLRRVMPPDRVWLAMMFRAGAYPFSNKQDSATKDPESYYDQFYTFDKSGTFEYRYARFRRYGDTRDPVVYQHELDQDLRGPE
jgi:hypothetical protein